jgi:HSP20 family protein
MVRQPAPDCSSPRGWPPQAGVIEKEVIDMAITDLIPWAKNRSKADQEEGALQDRQDPFLSFQQQMNQIFDDFFQEAGLLPSRQLFGLPGSDWRAFSPRVDVVETPEEISIVFELPGLEEKDIDLSLSRNVLTISGEKRRENEKKGSRFVQSERSYGAFQRTIPLSVPVAHDRASAEFRNGVLTVNIPRKDRVVVWKQIAVRTD